MRSLLGVATTLGTREGILKLQYRVSRNLAVRSKSCSQRSIFLRCAWQTRHNRSLGAINRKFAIISQSDHGSAPKQFLSMLCILVEEKSAHVLS